MRRRREKPLFYERLQKTLVIIAIAIVGTASAANYMYDKASFKGVG